MRNYEIKINVNRLLHYSGLYKSKLKNETIVMLINSFSLYIKEMYLTMIYESANSHRYKGNWEPVDDPEYLKYIGTTPGVDILELIYDSLEIRHIKKNIVVRINPNYMYPGSQRTLLNVLVSIDRGTSKFNARPLFRIIISKIQSNLYILWRNYLRQKGVI